MTYLNNLILSIIQLYPFKVLLVIIILLILNIIKCIVLYKIGTNHKIYNFYLNWFWISIYFFFYIGLFIYLRINAWGKSIDLKILLTKFLFVIDISYLLSILMLLTWILFIIVIYKSKVLLTIEIIKRHLYSRYSMAYAFAKKYGVNQGYCWYERILCKITYSYSFDNFIQKIFDNNIIHRFLLFARGNNIEHKSHAILEIIIIITPFIFLIILCFYDCYFNSFILTKIFYYLPFYLIYTLWYNLTTFLRYNSKTIDIIIYERYYEEDNIVYAGTTEEEDEYIFKYIRRGFKSFSFDFRYKGPEEYLEKLELFRKYTTLIKLNRRFVRDTKNMHVEHYYNPYTGERYIRDRSKDIDLD